MIASSTIDTRPANSPTLLLVSISEALNPPVKPSKNIN